MRCFPCGYGSRLTVSFLRPLGRSQTLVGWPDCCAGAMESPLASLGWHSVPRVRKRAYSASGVASRDCWPATEQATHYINSIYPWGPKVVPSVHYLMPLSRLISCYQKIAILGSRFCEQQQGPLKGLVAVAYFPCRYLPTVRFLQVLNFARIGAGVRTRPSNVRC